MIDESTIVIVPDDLLVADLDGEAVLLSVSTGSYYGLNSLGKRILEIARTPQSVGSIIQMLFEEYEVTYDQLRDDVMPFLDQLEKFGLIRRQ